MIGLEIHGVGERQFALGNLGTGVDLNLQGAADGGGERLHGDVETGRGTGRKSLGILDLQAGRLAHMGVIAVRDDGFRTGEVDVVGTDNVLGSGEGNGRNRDRLRRRVGDIDPGDGGEVLHRDGRGLGDGDALLHTEHRQVAAGQMRRTVQARLLLGAVGAGTDIHITATGPVRIQGFRIGNLGRVRIEQVPVVGFGTQGDFALGQARLGISHRELGI